MPTMAKFIDGNRRAPRYWRLVEQQGPGRTSPGVRQVGHAALLWILALRVGSNW